MPTTLSTATPNPNRSKKILGQKVPITRLGVGDKVRINKNKTGVVVDRRPADPTTKKGGSTTIRWKGSSDELRYDWDDYSSMEVVWLGEEVVV